MILLDISPLEPIIGIGIVVFGLFIFAAIAFAGYKLLKRK